MQPAQPAQPAGYHQLRDHGQLSQPPLWHHHRLRTTGSLHAHRRPGLVVCGPAWRGGQHDKPPTAPPQPWVSRVLASTAIREGIPCARPSSPSTCQGRVEVALCNPSRRRWRGEAGRQEAPGYEARVLRRIPKCMQGDLRAEGFQIVDFELVVGWALPPTVKIRLCCLAAPRAKRAWFASKLLMTPLPSPTSTPCVFYHQVKNIHVPLPGPGEHLLQSPLVRSSMVQTIPLPMHRGLAP